VRLRVEERASHSALMRAFTWLLASQNKDEQQHQQQQQQK
jgi:hypothetical protein